MIFFKVIFEIVQKQKKWILDFVGNHRLMTDIQIIHFEQLESTD